MKTPVTFGGITANCGERKTGWTPVPGTDCKLPVTVINGAEEGSTVLITSAIHGCEYPSIEAVFELAETIDPMEIKGQLVFINPVNVDAFLTRTPYIVPADGKNLNRLFPGDPNGTTGERIADFIAREFQRKADFHIDTHGGDIPEAQPDYVYYPGVSDHPKVLKKSKEAAEYVLHAQFAIQSKAVNHAYTHAAVLGVPSLELELGDCGAWTKEEVAQYKENILNVLKYLNVYPGTPIKREKPLIQITKAEYPDADSSGRWYAFAENDAFVKKGQKLGEIRDFFGNVLHEYYAEYDAYILMIVHSLAVQKGDPIVAYGAEE